AATMHDYYQNASPKMDHVNMGARRGHAIAYTTGTRAFAAGVVGPGAEPAKRSRVSELLYKENIKLCKGLCLVIMLFNQCCLNCTIGLLVTNFVAILKAFSQANLDSGDLT